ncbi:MAG TPA: cation transporter [Woeseiaceae bacterium]|nr:cation transporter [Woeseiaceae bacterium]
MPGCTDCSADATDRASSDPLFQRVLWIALIANLAMFFVEIVASHVGDSMSLQADALDFFSDSANYAISLFVVGMAITARAKASLFKGATMALFGTWVIGSAVYRAMTGSAPDPSMMGSIALLALVVNVAVAFLLYRYRAGDSNKQSIWLCSRNDAIGNVAVMLAAAGVFASASRWPDLLVAGVIAALNISAALHVIRLARTELDLGANKCDPNPPLDVQTDVP